MENKGIKYQKKISPTSFMTKMAMACKLVMVCHSKSTDMLIQANCPPIEAIWLALGFDHLQEILALSKV